VEPEATLRGEKQLLSPSWSEVEGGSGSRPEAGGSNIFLSITEFYRFISPLSNQKLKNNKYKFLYQNLIENILRDPIYVGCKI
jgi:hypothetical protein